MLLVLGICTANKYTRQNQNISFHPRGNLRCIIPKIATIFLSGKNLNFRPHSHTIQRPDITQYFSYAMEENFKINWAAVKPQYTFWRGVGVVDFT